MQDLILSCEHAGNTIPPEYDYLFKDHVEVLNSHRGWDPGALECAQFLEEQLKAPLYSCLTTRMLIEVNRSLNNTQLFSDLSTPLSVIEKNKLIQQIYTPYRNLVEESISSRLPAIHLSIHTFTPVWNGEERRVDIGLLFDPDRTCELQFCEQLQQKLETIFPKLRIKLNEPYHGKEDGFTTYLRTKFPDPVYAGIEIEVNQKFHFQQTMSPICEGLCESLRSILN